MDTQNILSKAVGQLREHAKENYATERALKSPPRTSLRGLVDPAALGATKGITLPWVSAAHATYRSHMAFSGIERVGGSEGDELTSRLEDDFQRESDAIASALIETGFAALLFGVEDTEGGQRIRFTTYSGKDSTVILNGWGDPEFGVVVVGREHEITTAEVHSSTGWTTVRYRVDHEGVVRVIDETPEREHGLGVCLFVPLVGKRIITEEAVRILGDAVLVHQMAFVSDALHTSPRELFSNVPLDAAASYRQAALGSPLNGPLVLPRIPEAEQWESEEARTEAEAMREATPLETQEVKYERHFGGDNTASYAEQLKRSAFSFVQVVPMPESWNALTPGGLNGIMGADELNKMSERFFATVSRLNRRTSRMVSRAVNELLAALGELGTEVEVVFGERTAYELDQDVSPETTMAHVEFMARNQVVDLSTPAGIALVGKLFNLNTETIGALQSAQLSARGQRLLDDAQRLAEASAGGQGQSGTPEPSEAPQSAAQATGGRARDEAERTESPATPMNNETIVRVGVDGVGERR